MMANTWAELINRHFKLEQKCLNITGNDLVKALKKPAHRYVSIAMDVDQQNVPRDHISVFCDMYQPQTSNKCIHCFYATIPGSAPIKGEKAWFEYIDLALDLLNKRTTCSQHESALQLASKIIITEDESHTRKQK